MDDSWGYADDEPRVDVRRMLQRRGQRRQRRHARSAPVVKRDADSGIESADSGAESPDSGNEGNGNGNGNEGDASSEAGAPKNGPATAIVEVNPGIAEPVATTSPAVEAAPAATQTGGAASDSGESGAESADDGASGASDSEAEGDPAVSGTDPPPADTAGQTTALPEASTTALPAEGSQPPGSFVTITTTAAAATSADTETALPVEVGSTTLTPITTDSAAATAPADKDTAAGGGGDDSGGGLNPAASAGVAIGVLALVALLVTGVVLFYRRRKRANGEHLDRIPPEKPPTSFPVNNDNHDWLRGESSIADEAISAAYANEEKAVDGTFYAPRSDQPQDNSNRPRQASAMIFQGPSAPAPTFQPPGQSREPAPSPPVPPPPPEVEMPLAGPSSSKEPLLQGKDIYPPGQVPISQYRMQSMAATEVTDSTEASWQDWSARRGAL